MLIVWLECNLDFKFKTTSFDKGWVQPIMQTSCRKGYQVEGVLYHNFNFNFILWGYIYVFSFSSKFKLSACVFLLTKYLSNTSLQMILTSCSIYIIMSKWSQPVISLRIILLLSCFSVFTDSHDKSRQLLNMFSISFSLLKLYQFSPTIVWARHFKFGLKD